MSRQFTGRFWKWVLPAGLAVGLFGFYAPVGADDDKEAEVKKVEVKRENDEERKEEARKDGDRKEERKEEARKDGDDRIDDLARLVKQLAGQVNELREEVRSLRSGGAGFGNPEEMKKRMEEMRKKFPAGTPEGLNPEKLRAEFEKRFRAEQEKLAGQGLNPEKMRAEFEKRFRAEHEKLAGAREGAGGDVEAQIRRQIEHLQGELKRIAAAKEREGDKKREDKEEKEEKEGADREEREAKERAAKEEAEAREEKKDDK